jgi:uncharacterized protein YcfL
MKISSLAALLMVGLMTLGCATQPATNSSMEREELKVDPDVLYSMTVTELFEKRLTQPGGKSLLQVQFAANAHADAQLDWKVTWFDAQGMQVKGVAESYRRASLLTGQTRYFTATAPHSRVSDYQLHLREPQ